jgi:hypothetical protein
MHMWSTKPRVMLGKCAETLALRRAFPAELSGIYTQEEMPEGEPAYLDVKTGEIVDKPVKQLTANPRPIACSLRIRRRRVQSCGDL